MEELRFACDAMLGRLARWLRFAGLDASFDAALPDLGLAAQARAAGRWLLTKDRRLAALAGPRVLLLHGGSIAEQVGELRARLPLQLDPLRFFTRCSCCNGELVEAEPEVVRDHVPPYVAARASRFFTCPGCGRAYWRGTHPARIERTLRTLFGLDEPTLD
ncbi:MAG: Mut7-C RNAse domain-containing protein [Thermoanaerobaculales bacterium]